MVNIWLQMEVFMKTLNRTLLRKICLLVIAGMLLSGCYAGIGPGGAGVSVGKTHLSSITL